ncbi:MAG: sugar-binding protein, partial [Pseudomonadota bacterium]
MLASPGPLQVLVLLLGTTALFAEPTKADEAPRAIPQAPLAPVIDGVADDPAWGLAEWREMDQLWLGSAPTPEDFSGRYKLVWTPEGLWLLAEITDDILMDSHPNPLERYWEDDALEIFLDEDASGGQHQYDHNAFAQHIALDNQSVDFAPTATGGAPALFPDMIRSIWRRELNAPHIVTWEVAITVFGDDYHQDPERPPPMPRTLSAGKR